jgi:hypothetical protein
VIFDEVPDVLRNGFSFDVTAAPDFRFPDRPPKASLIAAGNASQGGQFYLPIDCLAIVRVLP